MPLFSIHEANFNRIFDVNSTDLDKYPRYTSIESFIGRKCFEFEWISGDLSFSIGIASVISVSTAHFFGGSGNEQFRSRDTKGVDHSTNLSINFELNARYMFCFDMQINKVLLIYKNQTFSYNHNFLSNTKWNIIFAQGTQTRNSRIKGYFDYPFENPIPIAFYSLIDRRCYDYKSIKKNDFLLSISLFLINNLCKP